MVYSKLLVMKDKTYDIACNDIMKIQHMSQYRKCKKINTYNYNDSVIIFCKLMEIMRSGPAMTSWCMSA